MLIQDYINQNMFSHNFSHQFFSLVPKSKNKMSSAFKGRSRTSPLLALAPLTLRLAKAAAAVEGQTGLSSL